MIIPATILSLVFGSVGFIVTKNNAKYILSGYNTMSEQQRSKMDIDGYLSFFKYFHILLSVSLFVGTVLISFLNNNWASAFMLMYPLIAYLYLIIKGNSFYKYSDNRKLTSYFGCGILIIVIIIVGFTQLSSYKSNGLTFDDKVLEINGMYGMQIEKQNIFKLRLVDELPAISYKSNGFAAGDYAKGSFKAKNGKTIHLFVNKKLSQSLLLSTTDGDIYYNTDETNMNELYKKVEKWLRF
ncbi:DUF3784 domain-containing protein [Dyadobacter sp. NIV53]|uniref:DUF3784 domain-containing protein n=1 Tax=Dyadobacter sp. NIV53 TaxID=2861765 RepID=UPI001C87E552|nr:DUF3784 domain-containing protein [Dyadobacter sp. NIV53]